MSAVIVQRPSAGLVIGAAFLMPSARSSPTARLRLAHLALDRLCIASVLCRESAIGGPIEAVAAWREEPQKAVVQQASERHWHAQILGRRQREADVLESERRGESGRLKPAFGDQATVGLVSGHGEDRGSEQINVGTPIDARLADERDRLAQCLDCGGEQEVSAELDEIRCRGLRADGKGLLSQRVEERLAPFDRSGPAPGTRK